MVDKKSVRELFKALEEQFNFDLVALDKYKEVTSRRKKQSEIAKKMKDRGIAIEEIMDITGLSKEEVEKL